MDKRKSGKPVLGCFPLYPPVELFTSMGILPIVLWNLKDSVEDLINSDKHIQNYACGIAREMVQFVISETNSLLDGLFSYNACDTLRNIPEILAFEYKKKNRLIPMLRMHVPQVNPNQTNPEEYLKNEISLLIKNTEEAFETDFSPQKFAQTVEKYTKMRTLCMEIEKNVAQGTLSFASFCNTVLFNYSLPIEDQILSLQKLKKKSTNKYASNNKKVIVSGIMPPSPQIIKLMEEKGLIVVANDIASLRRSYAYSPSITDDPTVFYSDFFLNRYPCTTLLYKTDERLDAFEKRIVQSDARGVILSGEKFCEYEYFEFPYLEKKLKEKGIPTLFIEFSVDDVENIGAYVTRIEAFIEMLDN